MEKIIILALLVASGCAPLPHSKELAKRNGIQKDPTQNYYIDKVTLEKQATKANADKVGYCLASNIKMGEVSLSDTSRSFVGSYTGNYYNIESKGKASAEDVIKFISKDGVNSVARGQVDYIVPNWAAHIQKFLRFTVDIKQSDNANTYIFKDFATAQGNTGMLANNGFDAKWSDIEELVPERGYDELDNLANKINNCLAK